MEGETKRLEDQHLTLKLRSNTGTILKAQTGVINLFFDKNTMEMQQEKIIFISMVYRQSNWEEKKKTEQNSYYTHTRKLTQNGLTYI